MNQLVADLPVVLVCAAAFITGGVVKGVTAIGMPLVGLPLLTLVVDVPTAVGLLVVPILASNVVQGLEGSGTLMLLRRFSTLILCLLIGIFIGTAMLARLEQSQLLLVVGLFAVAASLAALLNPSLTIPTWAERWLAPPAGLAAGVVGGMSTLVGPILAVYLIGLKLPRDVFVKCMGLLYTITGICLLVGGLSQGMAGPTTLMLSALGIIPVYAGMVIGQRIRARIDPDLFRRLVLAIVLLTGANMLRQGLGF